MNEPGAHDEIEMGGLRRDFFAEVPAESQRRFIAAFPEMRLLWNPKIGLYQCVHMQPGWREPYYGTDGDGWLIGWSIVPGNYERPLSVDAVFTQLRARIEFAVEKVQRQGFATIADKVDAIYDQWLADAKQSEEDAYNDLLGLDPVNQCMKSGVVHLGNMLPSKSRSLPFAPEDLRNAVPATGSAQRRAIRAARKLRMGAVYEEVKT